LSDCLKGDGFAQRYVDGLERKRGSTEKETEGGEKMKQLSGLASEAEKKEERESRSRMRHCTCIAHVY